MGNPFDLDEAEEPRRARRKQRMAEMKKQKERREAIQLYIKKYGVYVGAFLIAVISIGTGIALAHQKAEAKENELAAVGTEVGAEETMPTESG